MNQKEKLALLTEWQVCIETSNRLIEPVTKAMGLSAESPIHAAVWSLQNAYTKSVGKLLGDKADWLDWYASENDFGRKKMEAGQNGAIRRISTLIDLVLVMEVTA